MSKIDWLFVGLGNPEKKYAETRHNIGWMVISQLSAKHNKPILQFSKNYLQSSLRLFGSLILCCMPLTYMNNSGKAVKEILNEYSIPVERMVVVVDEYNFPVGKVHLRQNGGDGGHNGIISIIDSIKSNDFYRLRCGIGRDFQQGEMAEYVLSCFNEDELEMKEKMIKKAIDSLEYIVRIGDIKKAMSFINSEKLWEEKKV